MTFWLARILVDDRIMNASETVLGAMIFVVAVHPIARSFGAVGYVSARRNPVVHPHWFSTTLITPERIHP